MTSSSIQRTLLALTLLAAPACGGSNEWAGTVADSAGVTIVTNPSSGLWRAADRPTVVRELDIGTAEGEAPYQFGQIIGLYVTEDTSIYILDQQARAVRQFDAAGRFVRQIGRPGSGPGELSQAPMAVLVGPGDTVLVPDMLHQRLTRFTSDGEPAGSVPLPFSEGVSVKWALMPTGHLLQQTRAIPMPGQATMPGGDFLFVRGLDGAIRDTLMRLPEGRTIQFVGGAAPRVQIFASEPMWTLADDGNVVFGVNSEYSIGHYTADGQLRRIVRRPFQQQPVTEADRAALRRFLGETIAQQGMPPQALQAMLDNIGFADVYPAFNNLMSGPEGSLWVQRVQTADEVAARGGQFDAQDVGSPTWDVFDADGRYLGPLELPARFTPLQIQGDRVWGVWRDDLDVQHVLRLRVTGTWQGR